MKRIGFILALLISSLTSIGQTKGYLSYDSLFIQKLGGGTTELILSNKTKDTSGFLFNKGGGKTEFKRALKKISDSVFIIGNDTLKIPKSNAGGSISGTVAQLRAMNTVTGQTYKSTDRGSGDWLDLGLNDGVYVDDGSIYIVTANGHALKRLFSGDVDVTWFGVKVNDGLTDSVGVKQAIAFVNSMGGGRVIFPVGVYNLPPITIPNRVVLIGQGNSHASVDVPANSFKGTVLMIAGVAGKSDVKFVSNTSFSGIENMSIYNSNSAAITAVVEIPGVLYPHLTNVEISSVVHTTGIGLYLLGVNQSPFWSSLYGVYNNVNVITNSQVGVRVALELWGINDFLPPNASRFLGGHFQGYELSLLIDGNGANTGAQGVEFAGTTFESYYNAAQRHEYVQNSVGMNAFSQDSSRYAVVWIHLKRSNQVTFNGCYFENGGVPFAGYNDGVHGTHQAFPVALIDTNSYQTTITGNTFVAGILDRGFGTTHPNKISFLDQNGIAAIEEVAVAGSAKSEIRFGTNNINGLKITEDKVTAGKIKIDQFLIDSLRILKPGGAALLLLDSNNTSSIESHPTAAGGSDMQFKVEGQNPLNLKSSSVSVNKRLKLLPSEVPISTTPYALMYDPTDSTIKRIDAEFEDTSVYAKRSSNLSDLSNKSVARSNLGVDKDSSRVGNSSLLYKDFLFYDDFYRPNTTAGNLGVSTFGTTYELLGYGLGVGNAETKIVNKRWVANRNGSTNETSYAIQSLNEDVHNIGGRWKWTSGNGGTDESVMIFIVGKLDSTNIVFNAVHIQVSRANIAFDFFVDGSSAGFTTKIITFPTLIAQDRDITANFTFVGNTCYYQVAGHNGKVTDPKFATQIGKVATYEPFFNSPSGLNGLSIGAIWVGNAKDVVESPMTSSDGTSHTTTGTTAETTLYSTTIKANSLGKNGRLRIEYLLSSTNNTNTKTFQVKVGGVLIGTVQLVSTDGFECVTRYSNRNSQIIGISPHPANNFQATGAAIPYIYSAALGREINWAIDNTLVITGTNSVSTDTIGVEDVHVFTYQ